MRTQWQQPAPDEKKYPWQQLSRQQALADLNSYLAAGIPPQSISRKINSDPKQPGRFPIKLLTPSRSPLTVNVTLGDAYPPSPLESTGHDAITSLKVVHPRSDHKKSFWTPLAFAGYPKDFGWLSLYLIIYLPTMFALKWLLRIP